MKKADDPRHKMRIQAVQALFANSFSKKQEQEQSLSSAVRKNQKEIDKIIAENAPAWPIDQISPIDLSVLRLAIWELFYKTPQEPYKVIIDEAVEIAKVYGQESSPNFVNGVLGSIVAKKLNVKNKES